MRLDARIVRTLGVLGARAWIRLLQDGATCRCPLVIAWSMLAISAISLRHPARTTLA